MSQNDAHWKQKYLTSLDKIEKKEKSWKELEELLRLGMNRVALAAQGVDEKLDTQLQTLRKSIRSDRYKGLEGIVEDISVSVKRLDDRRKEDESGGNSASTLLLQFVEQVQFPKQYNSQIQSLHKQLQKAAPDEAIDTPLRALSHIINESLKQEAEQTLQSSQEKKGLIDRLFNTSEKVIVGADNNTSLNIATATLNHLLQSIKPGVDDETGLDNLAGQLQYVRNEKSLNKLTLEISQFITKALTVDSAKQNNTATKVKHVAKDHTQTTAAKDGNLNLVSEILLVLLTNLSHSIISEKQTKQLQEKINNNPKPAIFMDVVNAVVEIINRTGSKTSSADNASSVSSITTHSQSQLPSIQNDLATFCLQLLETLQLPNVFDAEVQILRDKLAQGVDRQESAVMLNSIADLITATRAQVEKEKQELQEFLHQLTDRLKDIDSHLAGAETHSKSSYSSSKNFGDVVEAQMKGIESSVQDASELGQLKLVVQDRLDAIRNHLVTYQQDEEKSHRELLDELAISNARLSDMELETEELRARLYEEHAQAIHDKLTGIYNRLAYEERIEQEFQRWKRYKKPLVLLIFDVDHFKSINDNYGHKAGDKALRLIAQTLQKNLRETDFLARYGGEEFVILMPETDVKSAICVADKLREAVEQVQFNYQQNQLNITVSCGATQFIKKDNAETVFQRADSYLYKAKKNGRNRCHTEDKI